MSVSERLEQIREAMERAAIRSGRPAGAVRLVGASKTVSPEVLREAVAAGLKVFGENKVQELKAKAPVLSPGVEWHFIGGLQTNKVRDAVRWAEWIHSVDRVEVLEEIATRAGQAGKVQKILVEVNIGGEFSKHGCPPERAAELVVAANGKPEVAVHGLMTVAPFFEDREKVRPYFARLRELRDRIEAETGSVLPELSMGMSHDFETAIEEGATLVRVGTAIFGKR
jgi:pyridoxal phosphate enzyme (YggS family)